MARRKVKPNFLTSDAGLTANIEVDRYRRAQFEAKVAELEPRFPGLKATLTHDPLAGKTTLDFAPDPPPSTVTYTVSAPYPTYKVGPYTLRAVLTRDDVDKKSLWVAEEGAITREVVEGADFLRCDHCQTRRHRKTLYFFLKDGEEALTQVGSKCCKDFFGVDVERELAAFCRGIEAEFGDEDGWDAPRGGFNVNGYDAEYAVPVALVYVEKWGYVSRRKGEEWGKPSTATYLSVLFSKPQSNEPREEREAREALFDEATARKDELLKAFSEYATEARARLEEKWTEFLFNLCQNFEYTTLGFAAFIASDILKKRAEKRTPKVESKCLDKEVSTKQQDLGTYTLTFQREEDSDWGVSFFHVAKAEDGTTVFFRRSHSDLNLGDTFDLRGKVKKHLKDATVVGFPKVKVLREKDAEGNVPDTCPSCGKAHKNHRYTYFKCSKCKVVFDALNGVSA